MAYQKIKNFPLIIFEVAWRTTTLKAWTKMAFFWKINFLPYNEDNIKLYQLQIHFDMRKLHLSDVRALFQSLSKFWILNINVWYILLYNLNHHFWITFCTSAWALSKGVEFSKTFGSPWPITPPSMDDLNTRFAELPKKQSVIIVLQTNDQSNTGCPIWMEWISKSYFGFIFGARAGSFPP